MNDGPVCEVCGNWHGGNPFPCQLKSRAVATHTTIRLTPESVEENTVLALRKFAAEIDEPSSIIFGADAEDAALLRRAADLISRAPAGSEDTRRLEWLQRMLHDGEAIGDVRLWGSHLCIKVEVGEDIGIEGEGTTLRAAIDAARSREGTNGR